MTEIDRELQGPRVILIQTNQGNWLSLAKSGAIRMDSCTFARQSPLAIIGFLLKEAVMEVLRDPLGLGWRRRHD